MRHSATTPAVCGSLISSGFAMRCSESPAGREGSHRVYRMPRLGDPRVNIRSRKGMAKPYPVRQALKAIEKLEGLGE